MRRLVLGLYAVTALLHVLFAGALRAAAGWLELSLPWWAALAASLLLAVAFPFRLELMQWDRPISPLRRLFEELYFVHWASLVLGLVLTPFALVAAWGRGAWEVAASAYLMALPLAAWGVLVRRRMVRVVELELTLAELGPGLDGLRIAQLSDLHIGSLCPREQAARWVRRVNELAVDVVALTGDYATTGVRFHEDIAEVLAELDARHVLAVMGNHDYFGDGQPLLGLLAERGVRVLHNEHLVVERGGAELCVAGVDDAYTGRIDIDAALAGRDATLPLVVLAHHPGSFGELARRGADLVLSGHTHWGQLAVPLLADRFNLARRMTRYHAGLYRLGAAQLYVSPGLGTTGLPLRIGTWPEITVVTLRAGGRSQRARLAA